MSVSIGFKNVVKRYGQHTIINGLSLNVKEGEFFTLLGPSGCGKTTLLRMVAGFNSIEEGEIIFNDKVINDIPPSKRKIGMVFQSYAIFPHMTVAQNVAFGLKNRKLPKDEIKHKVNEILEIVKIYDLKDRLPEKLSGGQQQRVALARAIVIHPDVLLMDEPLSNLDAKLRVEMRIAIKAIQNRVGITTIYVTHDQEEALAISDRIAVMNKGIIQQVDLPKKIYQRPSNIFVSNFIGRSNIVEAKITFKKERKMLTFGPDYELCLDNHLHPINNQQDVKVSIRPNDFVINRQSGLKAVITDSIFLGVNTHYFAEILNGQRIEIIDESDTDSLLSPGAQIYLDIKKDKINVYDMDGTANLISGTASNAQHG